MVVLEALRQSCMTTAVIGHNKLELSPFPNTIDNWWISHHRKLRWMRIQWFKFRYHLAVTVLYRMQPANLTIWWPHCPTLRWVFVFCVTFVSLTIVLIVAAQPDQNDGHHQQSQLHGIGKDSGAQQRICANSKRWFGFNDWQSRDWPQQTRCVHCDQRWLSSLWSCYHRSSGYRFGHYMASRTFCLCQMSTTTRW